MKKKNTPQSGVIFTADILGGSLYLYKSKGILSGAEKLLVNIQAYAVDADGELTDRLAVRVFDCSDCEQSELETFLLAIKESDTLGSVSFALIGGVIDGVDFPPKITGVRRIR